MSKQKQQSLDTFFKLQKAANEEIITKIGYVFDNIEIVVDLLKQAAFQVLRNTEAISKEQGYSTSQIDEQTRDLKRILDERIDKILKKEG